MPLAIGIDLGTTNSCAAVYRDGQVEIIETIERDKVTPSIVYYGEEGIIVGKEAQTQSAIKPQNGIFDAKRMIGRKFNDAEVQKHLDRWPFKITEDESGEILIEIEHVDRVRPEEVSAEVLRKLKEDICRKTGEEVRDVVITVPAYFSNPQREATEDAARLAGLHVLSVINEPSAAALAHSVEIQDLRNCTVLVYDLGGGTFDVSVIKFHDNIVDVLCVGGDTTLGGRDLDDNLTKYCLEFMKESYRYGIAEQTPENQRRDRRRLKLNCEEVKRKLSIVSRATLEMDGFYGRDIVIEITRSKFEEINRKLFERTMKIVTETLARANISKEEIDEVIAVGGSTRIPKVQQLLFEYFKKPLNKSLNKEEAVAAGAAYHAASCIRTFTAIELKDITSFPFGIQVKEREGKDMKVLIEKGSKLPAAGFATFRTIHDNQSIIDLYIYEGDGDLVRNNTYLGKLTIEDITPKKKGKVEVKLIFVANVDGVLKVTAIEESNIVPRNLQICRLFNGRLTEEEIEERRRKRESLVQRISSSKQN